MLVLYILLVAKFAEAEVPFLSCGGEHVNEVMIAGCNKAPCTIEKGETYELFIVPHQACPSVGSLSTLAGIIQLGAYFEQEAVGLNPCLEPCPKSAFDFNVTISSQLFRIPSVLRVNTTYVGMRPASYGFCVDIEVYVI